MNHVCAETLPITNTLPVASANTLPIASANTIAIASANTLPITSANTIAIATANTLPIATANTLPIATANTLPIATANTLPIATANTLPIATANTLPIATANTLPIATANTLPIVSAKPLPTSSHVNSHVARPHLLVCLFHGNGSPSFDDLLQLGMVMALALVQRVKLHGLSWFRVDPLPFSLPSPPLFSPHTSASREVKVSLELTQEDARDGCCGEWASVFTL
ncbi:unnamed protein product [Closterium sp. NIES-64]|nr:unnamed protein product [Closterium sp. NIES-64]